MYGEEQHKEKTMSENRYARIIDEKTHEVQVGVGCDDAYYEEIGMTKMDVEQAYNGLWYQAGYAPSKPEPTVDEMKAQVRMVRTNYIYGIEWRVSRYKQQTELKIQTADSAETYTKVLQYIQYLRDYPQSGGEWYKSNPLTFDEWMKK